MLPALRQSTNTLSILSRRPVLLASVPVLAAGYWAYHKADHRNLGSSISSLFHTSSSMAVDDSTRPNYKPDSEWKSILTPQEYQVIRGKGTERPYAGEYDSHYPKKGVYKCRACETPLYTAEDKFKSGCGWPAFASGFKGAIERHTDSSLGMERTEIVCANCGGHLGHVFKGERLTPTNERHCVNSISVRFDPEGSMEGEKE